MNELEERLVLAIESLARDIHIIVEEGITIYEHQGGTENQN